MSAQIYALPTDRPLVRFTEHGLRMVSSDLSKTLGAALARSHTLDFDQSLRLYEAIAEAICLIAAISEI